MDGPCCLTTLHFIGKEESNELYIGLIDVNLSKTVDLGLMSRSRTTILQNNKFVHDLVLNLSHVQTPGTS